MTSHRRRFNVMRLLVKSLGKAEFYCAPFSSDLFMAYSIALWKYASHRVLHNGVLKDFVVSKNSDN